MKKLNNKGFAITGILYTILILFCLILVSILSGLSARNTFLTKAIDTLSDNYESKTISSEVAPADGKYVYYKKSSINSSEYERCYKFLKQGESLPKDGEGTCIPMKNITDSDPAPQFYEFK